jgi:cation transport protein ChaC
MTDPFHHHPNLRHKIKPAEDSFFRTITTDAVRAMLAERGIEDRFPFYSDAERERLRRAALQGHDGDLLVFAYGSLLWDPALHFSEVRRAHAPHNARRFILVDTYGGRGTEDAPGLMAALDAGPGCDGLVFRIPRETVDRETEILFRREMIGPGYHALFVPVRIDGAEADARALTFIADHDDPLMRPGITRAEQVRFAATGEGFLGTSYEYLRSTVSHLTEMGIEDADASALLSEVEAVRA